jgi:hypothetical protein
MTDATSTQTTRHATACQSLALFCIAKTNSSDTSALLSAAMIYLGALYQAPAMTMARTPPPATL